MEEGNHLRCEMLSVTQSQQKAAFIILYTYPSTSPKFQIINLCICSSKQPVTYCRRLNDMIQPADRLETISHIQTVVFSLTKALQFNQTHLITSQPLNLYCVPTFHLSFQFDIKPFLSNKASTEPFMGDTDLTRQPLPDTLSTINMQASERIERGICLWFHQRGIGRFSVRNHICKSY